MARSDWRIWSEEECSMVHQATLRLLSEVGCEFRHRSATELLRHAGARVEGTRVYLPPDMVDSAIASAPSRWVMPWRHHDETLTLEDGRVYFGTGSDVLYVRDLQSGERRRAEVADVEGMAALCERLAHIDFVMSMGLPSDVPQHVDDLAQMVAMLKGTRKPIVIAPRDGTVVPLMKEMARAAGNSDSFAVYAMPSPPLQHDPDAITKIVSCAENNVPIVYAPAPCGGTTAPASTSSVVLVGNAEVLSGLVLHQLVNPGAPFVYGAGVDIMDMRDVVPSYVLPEVFSGNHAACDLARHYGMPSFAYAGDSDSKVLDEQWSAEAALTTALGALSRATLLHDVGYLETGLQSSYESIVLGNELIGFVKAYMRPLDVDDVSLAVDEIAAVGPGGEHLARKYTRQRFREFWLPELFDHAMYDRWAEKDGLTLGHRLRMRTLALVNEPRIFQITEKEEARLAELLAKEVPERKMVAEGVLGSSEES